MKNSLVKLAILTALTGLVAFLCLFVGPVGEVSRAILLELRLPRVLLAILVGFGLSAAGAVLQGVLRNPLADPFIMGTSSAAAAGIMLAGLAGIRQVFALYAVALVFAVLSIFLVYRVAQTSGRAPVQTLVLAGVIISLFFNALVFIFFSIFYQESHGVLFFLLGTLTSADPLRLGASAVIILGGLLGSWLLSFELNLLTQGEEAAFHLGVSVETTKRLLFFCASAMVAAAVSVAGMIGFVGLIVPHIMRMILGADHRILIPASALGGAVFLILADAIARTAFPPLEIPVGALTALLGSPFFIYLLRRRQSEGEF